MFNEVELVIVQYKHILVQVDLPDYLHVYVYGPYFAQRPTGKKILPYPTSHPLSTWGCP